MSQERYGKPEHLSEVAAKDDFLNTKNVTRDDVLGGRFDVSKLTPMLEDLHERMTGVIIERLDWRKFIARWDPAGTLFYLDPPYYGNEND